MQGCIGPAGDEDSRSGIELQVLSPLLIATDRDVERITCRPKFAHGFRAIRMRRVAANRIDTEGIRKNIKACSSWYRNGCEPISD